MNQRPNHVIRVDPVMAGDFKHAVRELERWIDVLIARIRAADTDGLEDEELCLLRDMAEEGLSLYGKLCVLAGLDPSLKSELVRLADKEQKEK